MLLYTRLAPPKTPKTRSRAGCNYCKEKKKKCDEGRPQCSRCREHKQDCVYEPIKPRQRRKREQLSVDTTSSTTKPGVSIRQWQRQQQRRQQQQHQRRHSRPDGTPTDDAFSPVLGDGPSDYVPLSTPSIASDLDTIFPWTPEDTTIFTPMTPMTSAPFDLHIIDGQSASHDGRGDQDDVEEIIRSDYSPTAPCSSTAASLALGRRRSTDHQQLSSPYLEFCAPVFAEFSERKNRRHLVDHFCNVLSHLIVFREENGNPFQQLVLPLSHSSPAVMNTIYALSSAHLEFRGVTNDEKSDYFHGKAIQELAHLIDNGGGDNRSELLAAIMLLVYYEVLVQKGRSNIVDGHLKGAMTIMSNREASTDPTSVFLERAFRFYDVIAALSFGTAPLSAAPGRGPLSHLTPLDSRGATSPVGSVDTLLGMATTLWPIIHRLSNLAGVKEELDMAMAQGQISKAAVLRTELETTASAIQVALNQWQPILPADSTMTHSERARLQSILNNALSYRHSAFVYLYRTIYGHARSHTLIQYHTHLSLTHCVGTVSGEGPMSALLWPLFVAACEATTAEDKDLAEQTFVAIDRVQGMANIERAWYIVQEVWRRADEAEEENGERQREASEREIRKGAWGCTHKGGDLWRRVSREMGVTVVFG